MEQMLQFVSGFGGFIPYLMLFGILLACGLGVPVPEDITLFVGGMLAYYGMANVWIMIGVCMAGVLIGDTTIFLLGAKYGHRITQKAFFHKFLPEQQLAVVKEKFHEKGNKVIFAARFMPGLRAPTFFCAGTLHLPFRVFFFYDGMAALISVPAIVWTVYHFGEFADEVIDKIRHVEHGIIFIVLAILVFILAKWYLKQRKQPDLVIHKPITHKATHSRNKSSKNRRQKKRRPW